MTKHKYRATFSTADRAKILDSVEDLVATDPLSVVSRGERKVLLILALVTIAVAKGGLVPSEVPALGITLQPAERLSLLYLFIAILAFYLIGFSLYGRADPKRRKAVLASKRSGMRETVEELMRIASQERPNDPEDEKRWYTEIGEASDAIGLVTDIDRFSRLRIIFDVYAPLIIGSVALLLALHETRNYPGGKAIGLTVLSSTLLSVAIFGWVRRKKIRHRLLVKRTGYTPGASSDFRERYTLYLIIRRSEDGFRSRSGHCLKKL